MQLSAEDTYDVADKVLEIPVDRIRPAPDNVRSDLGDLEPLAASIREIGVLQPVTVIPDGDGETFMLMLGARRHAAAQLAGLMTIPTIVKSKPGDAKRTVAMLIENVHRLDITALDEARTFDRLETEFGLTQEEISDRCGCSQSHVSKRRSLLALPAKARELLDARDDKGRPVLSITDALEMTKLVDDPDLLDPLVKNWADWDPESHAYELEEATEQAERAAKLAAAIDALNKKKITVLDDDQAKRAHQIFDPDSYAHGKKLVLAKADVKKHAKEDCHAVHPKAEWGGKIVEYSYCVNIDRHGPKGDSKLKAITEPKNDTRTPDPREQELNRKRTERIARRRAFVTELVRERKLAKGEVATLALTRVALDGYASDHEKTAKLLGLDLNGRDATQALTDHIAGGHDAMLRAALASMLRNADTAFTNERTDELLATLGYEPSEEELADQQLVDATRAAEAVADRIYDRVEELDVDEPDIGDLVEELNDGVTVTRAGEIQAILDTKFAELNKLEPGDIVDQADDGTHTIERAEQPEDDTETVWVAYGALAGTGSMTCVRPETAGDEIAATIELNGTTLHHLGTWPDKPAEIEVVEALQHARAATNDVKGCPFPTCMLEEEHDGAHRTRLKPFAKAPKDCSAHEHFAQLQIVDALEMQPDDQELLGLYEELRTGVDDARATEIHTRLTEWAQERVPVLTEYAKKQPGPMEQSCRELIKTVPAEDPQVMELQQELYRGINTGQASAMKKKLKLIAAELAKAAS